jgi:hypothetical protein
MNEREVFFFRVQRGKFISDLGITAHDLHEAYDRVRKSYPGADVFAIAEPNENEIRRLRECLTP